MAAITLRLTKGTPLTNAEIDGNFTNLNSELATKLNTSQYTAADILTKLKTVDGTGSGLDADLVNGKAPTALNQVSTVVLRDASGNFAANTITANLTGNVTGNLTGNATTVTNGVYTSSSYANPVWITSLAGSKVTSIPNSSLTNSSITINGVNVALGASGSILNVTQTWTGVQTFRDNAFIITDQTDTTKRAVFDSATISPNTTRTYIFPDENGTLTTVSYVDNIITRANNWTGAQTFRDNAFFVADNGDVTKRLALELSGVTTNTTRTLTVPNENGTIATREYVAGGTGAGSFTTFSANALITAGEKTTVSATASTGTIQYDLLTQSILYYTVNATGNWTLNLRGNGSTTLNSMMAVGETRTITFLATQGSTAFYQTALTVDGSPVTPKWQSGVAITSGNTNGIDVYTLAIVKTASGVFTVLESSTKFA